MDEITKALGFRVVEHGDIWQVQYVDSDGKTVRVVPCAMPVVWALWQAVLNRSGLLPSEG